MKHDFLRLANVVFLILASFAATTSRGYAQGDQPPTADRYPVNGAVLWDGKSPMKVGVWYRLPNCDTSDVNAPCYVLTTSSVVQTGKLTSGPTLQQFSFSQTQRCTRNVTTQVGGQLVQQLWEDVTVYWHWNPLPGFNYYDRVELQGGSYGWWSLDWRYVWQNFNGPSPVSGRYISQVNTTTSADSYYLGMKWRTVSVTQWNSPGPGVTSPNWGCW
jgi:hypothetical protein